MLPNHDLLSVPLNIYFYVVVMSLYNRLGPYGDLCVKCRDRPGPLPISNSNWHHQNNATPMPKGLMYSAYQRY